MKQNITTVAEHTRKYAQSLTDKRERINRAKTAINNWWNSGDYPITETQMVNTMKKEYKIEMVYIDGAILDDIIVHDEAKFTMFLLKYGS